MRRKWLFFVGIVLITSFVSNPTISTAQSPSEEVNTKIVTFNMQAGAGADGKYDLDRAAAELCKLDADVIGLQEVDVH